MAGRTVEELREELNRLMTAHIQDLERQAFIPLTDDQLREQEELLQRIREVSADYLAALKRTRPTSESDPKPQSQE